MYSIEKRIEGLLRPVSTSIRGPIWAPEIRAVLASVKKMSHLGLTSLEMALGCRGNYLYNYIVYVCNAAD